MLLVTPSNEQPKYLLISASALQRLHPLTHSFKPEVSIDISLSMFDYRGVGAGKSALQERSSKRDSVGSKANTVNKGRSSARGTPS